MSDQSKGTYIQSSSKVFQSWFPARGCRMEELVLGWKRQTAFGRSDGNPASGVSEGRLTAERSQAHTRHAVLHVVWRRWHGGLHRRLMLYHSWTDSLGFLISNAAPLDVCCTSSSASVLASSHRLPAMLVSVALEEDMPSGSSCLMRALRHSKIM